MRLRSDLMERNRCGGCVGEREKKNTTVLLDEVIDKIARFHFEHLTLCSGIEFSFMHVHKNSDVFMLKS